MNELIFMLIIFFCGAFAGLIAGAFFAAAREADDFDGGYSHNHRPDVPRARTIIYSHDVEDK